MMNPYLALGERRKASSVDHAEAGNTVFGSCTGVKLRRTNGRLMNGVEVHPPAQSLVFQQAADELEQLGFRGPANMLCEV